MALKTQGRKFHRTRHVLGICRIRDNEENLNEVPCRRLYSYQQNTAKSGIKSKTKGVLNSGIIHKPLSQVKVLQRLIDRWRVFREFNHVTGIQKVL